MDRSHLIDRKHQVIAQIRRTRQELEAARVQTDRRSMRRAAELERRLEQLMAEEYRLRQQIDRSG